MVSILLSLTFGCGVFIAMAHVINKKFIAPVYDVAANLIAFICAAGSSLLLHELAPAILAGFAIICWMVLGMRTYKHKVHQGAKEG